MPRDWARPLHLIHGGASSCVYLPIVPDRPKPGQDDTPHPPWPFPAAAAPAHTPARIVPVAELNPPPVSSPWLPDSVANENVRLAAEIVDRLGGSTVSLRGLRQRHKSLCLNVR